MRLDSLYDVIVELEEKIEDARLRRDAIKQQAITLENIYKIMVNFDCVYNIINVSTNKRRYFGTYHIGLDRFPMTDINPDLSSHVETIALISRKDKYGAER